MRECTIAFDGCLRSEMDQSIRWSSPAEWSRKRNVRGRRGTKNIEAIRKITTFTSFTKNKK